MKNIKVRVSDELYEDVCAKAEVAGSTVSSIIRKSLQSQELIVSPTYVYDSEWAFPMLKELRAVGVNLNQIARSLNRMKPNSEIDVNEILKCVALIQKIERKILKEL